MLRWIAQIAHAWIHRTGVNGLIVLLMMLTLGFVLTTVWWQKSKRAHTSGETLPRKTGSTAANTQLETSRQDTEQETEQRSNPEYQELPASSPPIWLGMTTETQFYFELPETV
ncbi:MAG: hypothetical protein R3C56_41430 [Pirellulaceae bacterium]